MPYSNYPSTEPRDCMCLKVYDSKLVTYVNATENTLYSGDVVQLNNGTITGIVARDTEPGKSATLETEGTWYMPNDTSNGITIAQGAPVCWDAENGVVIAVPATSGSYNVIGFANRGYTAFKGERIAVTLVPNANSTVTVSPASGG